MNAETLSTSDRVSNRARPPGAALFTGYGAILALMATAFAGLGLLDGAGGVLWSDVIAAFGVSKGGFGLLSGFGLALSFPILLAGARLSARFDKRTLLAISFLGMGLASLGLMTGTGGIVVFALSLIVRSASITLLDLSNNALAMDYEQATGRHIMSPLHAAFSGGTILGAGLVWTALAAGGGYHAVYLGLAAIFAGATVWAIRVRRLTDLLVTERVAGASSRSASASLGLLRRRDIRWFAAITGLAFAGESLISQWASIYLRDERGYSARSGVYAIGAYGLSMFIGRMINGPLAARLGSRNVLRVQGVTALTGGIMIVAGGPPAVAIAGCGLGGLGLAGMGPIALSLAGRAMQRATAAASAAVLAGGYLGFAGAPVAAGLVSEVGSARLALTGVGAAGLLVIGLAWRLPEPDDTRTPLIPATPI